MLISAGLSEYGPSLSQFYQNFHRGREWHITSINAQTISDALISIGLTQQSLLTDDCVQRKCDGNRMLNFK